MRVSFIESILVNCIHCFYYFAEFSFMLWPVSFPHYHQFQSIAFDDSVIFSFTVLLSRYAESSCKNKEMGNENIGRACSIQVFFLLCIPINFLAFTFFVCFFIHVLVTSSADLFFSYIRTYNFPLFSANHFLFAADLFIRQVFFVVFVTFFPFYPFDDMAQTCLLCFDVDFAIKLS